MRVESARNKVLGKILRYQNSFEEAVALLGKELEGSQIDEFFTGTGWYRVGCCRCLFLKWINIYRLRSFYSRKYSSWCKEEFQDITTNRRLWIAETFFGINAAQEVL